MNDISDLVDTYKNLRKNKNIPGQAHHLNQDAAFRDVIPRDEGIAIKLEGNIRKDIGSPHYKAHEAMEEFWDNYRKNGDFYGDFPKMSEYNTALEKSLIHAGVSEESVKNIMLKVVEQQRLYGLTSNTFIPRIPRKIYLPK